MRKHLVSNLCCCSKRQPSPSSAMFGVSASAASQRSMHGHAQTESVIPLWKYSDERSQWTQHISGGHHNGDVEPALSVLTFNIWFSDRYQPMRFHGLCKILEQSRAQVIGLQEGLLPLHLPMNSQLLLSLSLFCCSVTVPVLREIGRASCRERV